MHLGSFNANIQLNFYIRQVLHEKAYRNINRLLHKPFSFVANKTTHIGRVIGIALNFLFLWKSAV